jgi:hypothetical protein
VAAPLPDLWYGKEKTHGSLAISGSDVYVFMYWENRKIPPNSRPLHSFSPKNHTIHLHSYPDGQKSTRPNKSTLQSLISWLANADYKKTFENFE